MIIISSEGNLLDHFNLFTRVRLACVLERLVKKCLLIKNLFNNIIILPVLVTGVVCLF